LIRLENCPNDLDKVIGHWTTSFIHWTNFIHDLEALPRVCRLDIHLWLNVQEAKS